MLELMQDASSVTAKVETLAQDLATPEQLLTPSEAASHSQLMERIASEVSRLNFYMAKGQVRCNFVLFYILLYCW